MLSEIRDMLGDFSQEVQGIEDLEVAGRAGHQFVVPRFVESAHGIMLGLGDHLGSLGHLDHPGVAEGTPKRIFDEALYAFLIARVQPWRRIMFLASPGLPTSTRFSRP